MDLLKAIEELHKEKKRLDEIISRLEQLAGTVATSDQPKKRRGRKNMPAEERLAVSQRMKEYWARRRGQFARGAGAIV
jgi:hypothetical protein